MKIALVHDHLVQDGGAELVLKVLKEIYPQAPIFTLVLNRKNTNNFFIDKKVNTSFLQKLPLGVRRYQWYLSMMPAAIESHNLMGYDLVISSASSFAKGVITNPACRHICYCYTPTRYLWNDTHNYLEELKVNFFIKKFLPLTLRKLRVWDRLAADRVDHFVAISETVKNRIKKYYDRDSEVIYPPVEVNKFYISGAPKKYFLAGGRLVPYKKIDLAVKAFSRLGIPLKIFGVGPEERRLKRLANKGNIEFLGKVSETEKKELFANCLAYLNPQEEDFGITAVEAMASGRPVIAFRAGGATETVREGETGEFFEEQIWEELADKIIRFRPETYNSERIRERAKKFDVEIFKEKILQLVKKLSEESQA
ncbi:MAG: glycosyltransferase [Patescibacteria group bacterium]